MGKRRLAYTVRRFHEGIYVLMVVEGGGAVMHELERRLRVTEQVIKFLTVRTDEEQKRLDKVKALRDAKKKVSAQPAAPAPRSGGSAGGSGGGSSGDGVETQWSSGSCRVSANLRSQALTRSDARIPESLRHQPLKYLATTDLEEKYG